MPTLRITSFRADITPPIGHPMCAGWHPKPANKLVDNLFALGVVLVPEGQPPVVLCAIDWVEVSHADNKLWREKLGKAAGTTADRVAVQCVHTHEGPWPDREAQALVEKHDPNTKIMFLDFCDAAIERVAAAVKAAMASLKPVTHIGTGEAEVRMVASNRRILGPDGKVKAVRWTATKDPAVRAEPEGLIDPMLKTISFWNGDSKLAALHYYATHPNSYGGVGEITKDFAGLAREQRQAEEPGTAHIYFTACAGNVTAGKYNDGNPVNRPVLTQRIHQGLVDSEKKVERFLAERLEWRTVPVELPPREDFDEKQKISEIADLSRAGSERIKSAMHLAYLRQTARHDPTWLTSLHFGNGIVIVHLPGEPFIEYQLLAQHLRHDAFVAVAGYGDCSGGYICLERSYDEGGYEPTDAFVSRKSESLMVEAIGRLMRQ
ncbi:MAG: hypothetical protein EXS18_05535 [Verrucomicrobiae bacterium]|nr:hypothetical protein [Verrucomicrobiae bacterium]